MPDKPDKITVDRAKQARYAELLHAMQTGIAFLLEQDSSPASPKHVRLGINSAKVEHGALVSLLLAKGVFTAEEYLDAILAQMEKEVAMYEAELSARLAKPVKLR